MKHGKRWSICLLVGLMLLCFSTVSVVAYDQTSAVLSKMQGNWYDGNGNVVLDIEGQSINGCNVIGVTKVAGGGSDFSCSVQIAEADGYRNLYIIAENLGDGKYHSYLILNGKLLDDTQGVLLTKSPTPQYYESVGGIGIDTPKNEVIAKYGQPDVVQKSNAKSWRGLDTWVYQKLGLELTMRFQRVWKIKIDRNGNRHFDRTNFNCENSLSEFKAAYGFKQMPRAGQDVDLCYTRPGEYMWFSDYPNSITLTTYPLF